MLVLLAILGEIMMKSSLFLEHGTKVFVINLNPITKLLGWELQY